MDTFNNHDIALGFSITIEHLAVLLVPRHQPGIDQRLEVMRQGRRGEPQVSANIADAQAVFPGLHQQARDREAGIMAKGGKSAGAGTGRSDFDKK